MNNDQNVCVKSKKEKNIKQPKDIKDDMTYKSDVEKFIKGRWSPEDGEKLEIKWMDEWEDHYRLNFWKTKNIKSIIPDNYINRSILVCIEQTPDGWVEKEYKK